MEPLASAGPSRVVGESLSAAAVSPESYIGSSISITSKSEIRYEGVLLDINTAESCIGLRNVRSFGTEGRKKEGPEIPAIDKVYEYILFRASDIKDLQVKSCPAAQSIPLQCDPAIIQSHYAPAASPPSNFPSVRRGNIADPSSYTSQPGHQGLRFQESLPSQLPFSGSWNPSVMSQVPLGASTYPVQQMYCQGFYQPPSGYPHLQQPPGVSMPLYMQQSSQYPGMDLPLPSSGAQKTQDRTNPVFQSGISNIVMGSGMMPSVPVPSPSGCVSLEQTESRTPTVASQFCLSLPAAASGSLVTSEFPDNNRTSTRQTSTSILVNEKAITSENSVLPVQTSCVGSSGIASNSAQAEPSVVFGALGSIASGELASLSFSRNSQNEESKLGHAEMGLKQPLLSLESTESLSPLPTPIPSMDKYRFGGRSSGTWYSCTPEKITEDFDFVGMNEKFKKAEVWGDLGKSNARESGEPSFHVDEYDFDGGEAEVLDKKPVYVKDEFFDTLSCGLGQQNGNFKFSEQRRPQSHTFGYVLRPQMVRGGRGYRGRVCHSNYGRGHGYGYFGRGRGTSY